jgi:hypothetical protein
MTRAGIDDESVSVNTDWKVERYQSRDSHAEGNSGDVGALRKG